MTKPACVDAKLKPLGRPTRDRAQWSFRLLEAPPGLPVLYKAGSKCREPISAADCRSSVADGIAKVSQGKPITVRRFPVDD